jgi:protein-tyrosine phosphatase
MSKENIKILFVCMGNICRSPTAEGIFRHHAHQEGVTHLFEIDSAGTHAYHVGEAPDKRSQAVAKSCGVDLSRQKARQFHESDFYHYDAIFAMDNSNLTILRDNCPKKYQHKMGLILDNCPNAQSKNVPDPYYNNGFDKVFNMLEKCTYVILQNFLKGIQVKL